MFHSMWNPEEDDLIKFKVLLMVSIPICMLIPLVLNIIMPSPLWYLLAGIWLIFTIIARIILSVRFSSKLSDDVKLSRNEIIKNYQKKRRNSLNVWLSSQCQLVSLSAYLFFLGLCILSVS